MRHRRSIGSIAIAVALAAPLPGAHAFDDAKYPDLKGQWIRIGHAQWDPAKPPGFAQQPPLTPEHQRSYEASVADQAAGGQGNNRTPLCFPPGMPRAMIGYEPMEVLVTPEATYMMIQFMNQSRHIHTDGRDWPAKVVPSFIGYSIGQWIDEDRDGRYDTLVVETRSFKGPRTFEGNMPLHADNQTVVKERISLDKANPDILHDEITTIDHALTHPWTINRSYHREPITAWYEYPCSERNEHVFIGKENYYMSGDGYLMPARKDQAPPDLRYFTGASK